MGTHRYNMRHGKNSGCNFIASNTADACKEALTHIKESERDDNYSELANAIIEKACYDYRHHAHMREEVTRFFNSKYFQILTDIDGSYILRKLEEEING